MKKRFFLSSKFQIRGAGKSIYNLCKYLSKKKYDLFIISLGKNSYNKQLKNTVSKF